MKSTRTSLIAALATAALCLPAIAQLAAQPAAQFTLPPASTGPTFQVTDLYHFQNANGVELSPDEQHLIYSVSHSDSAGRPRASAMVMDLATKQSTPLLGGQNGAGRGGAGAAHWSPDGKWIAYQGSVDGKVGLCIAQLGGASTFLAPLFGTNAPLPGTGNHISWSPDGKQIAYVSATPGPEQSANGDPHVISRYLYKPTASEGVNPYNDNARLHIFVVDIATKKITQLTDGDRYEHSVQWSPKGDVILFESNLQPNPDQDFNYDILTIKPTGGPVTRLTNSVGPKYSAVWSPDGKLIAYTHTIRPITSMETTGEDTHLWIMNADGTNPHKLTGQLDLRYGAPQWSDDGAYLYNTVQDRGQTRLIKTSINGGAPTTVIGGEGSVSSFAVAKDGTVAYAYATPSSPSNLYLLSKGQGTPEQLTDTNRALLTGKTIAPVRRIEFKSFDGTQVEAFLTEPTNLGANPAAASVPLILNLHGGPHAQQGPEFNNVAQIYAGHGFATLMVNYRGSTGYGQKFEDQIINDQDGGEAKDCLAALDAALAKYKWLDPNLPRSRRRQLRRPARRLAHHPDQPLQSRHPHRRNLKSSQLQLPLLLPRLHALRIQRLLQHPHPQRPTLGPLRHPLRRPRQDPRPLHPRSQRQRRPHRAGPGIFHRPKRRRRRNRNGPLPPRRPRPRRNLPQRRQTKPQPNLVRHPLHQINLGAPIDAKEPPHR